MIFKDAIQLIQDGNYTNIKVTDTNGKRVLDVEGETSQSLIEKLQAYKQQLCSFGRVNFMVATDAIKKANWKDAYVWPVTFGGEMQSNSPALFSPGQGFVSEREAMLMGELSGLRKEVEWNKRFDEINKKLDEKNSDEFSKFLPLLPMLGLFVDIKPEKMQAMAALSQMAGAMTQKPGMAGLIPTDSKTVVKGTDEEVKCIKSINDNLEKLSEKVPVDKIDEFIKTLNEKPEFLTMLMQMASNYK